MLIRLVLLATLALAAVTADAQSAHPLARPNLDLHGTGPVAAVAMLPDGGWIASGPFSSVEGEPRTALARFAADGSLVAGWHPRLTGATVNVWALAVDGAGNVYVGGLFGSIDGVARANLARLKPDGSVDPGWRADTDDGVGRLALDNGSLFVSGAFLTIGGQAHGYMAKLAQADGALNAAWQPQITSVYTMLPDGQGKLFVGGYNGVVKLSTSGTGAPDSNWNPQIDHADQNVVMALALDAQGHLYIGGEFQSVGGQPVNSLARVSATGTGAIDASWIPQATQRMKVTALALDGAGNIYAGGSLYSTPPLASRFLSKLSIVNAAMAAGWDTNTNADVYALAMTNDGHVLVGGSYGRIGPSQHLGLARLDSRGEPSATSSDTEGGARVWSVLPLPDGKMLVGGDFKKANGRIRTGLLRLLADGSLDPDFAINTDGAVVALAQDGAGNAYVGGGFASVDGVAHANVVKLSMAGNGEVDAAWAPSVDGPVYALAADATAVFIGGAFSNVNSLERLCIAKIGAGGAGVVDASWHPGDCVTQVQSYVRRLILDGSGHLYAAGIAVAFDNGNGERGPLARLSTTGAGLADPTWAPRFDNAYINALMLDSSGHLYVGGAFLAVDGVPFTYAARLALSGTNLADASWKPALRNYVYDFAADGKGRIYIGGSFGQTGASVPRYLARYAANGDGSADPTFVSGVDDSVLALARDARGQIVVGGAFQHILGQPRHSLAALSDDALFGSGFDIP